jgi:hypothetical protein
MRYLLTPITMFIWFLLIYLEVYYGMVLMLWMFSLSWIWLILGYTFLIGLIAILVTLLPWLINELILNFYRWNWFSIIIHSITGLLGIVYTYYLIYQNPPQMLSGNVSTPILKALWNQSWPKTILFMIPFIGLQFALIYNGIFSPITTKLDENK